MGLLLNLKGARKRHITSAHVIIIKDLLSVESGASGRYEIDGGIEAYAEPAI